MFHWSAAVLMVSWKVSFPCFNYLLSLLREIVISGSEILIFVQRCCKTKRVDDTSNEISLFFGWFLLWQLGEACFFEWFRGGERTSMRAARVLSVFELSAQSCRVFELEVYDKTTGFSIKTNFGASVHVISTCVFSLEHLRKNVYFWCVLAFS